MKRRFALLCGTTLLVLFLTGAGTALAAEDISETPPVFSRVGDDGILVAMEENWYLEEFDAEGRPVTGTLWKKGEIAERTSWLYVDESQQPSMKIVTGNDGTVETEYDRSGNVVSKKTSDAENVPVETVTNAYDRDNNLVLSEVIRDGVTTRTETEYENGERKVRRTLKDGMPLITWEWTDEENWTETVFLDGSAVLVVEYVNGTRKEGSDEKH